KLALLQDLQRLGVPMYNGVALEEMEVKPFRLIRMAEAGIPIPETVFTQDPGSVRALQARHDRLIYKPVMGGARAEILRPDDLQPERARLLERAPVTFQELAPGADVRIFVCDGEVIGSVRFHTDRSVDFRGRVTGIEAIDPAPEIARAARMSC